ncbi:peptidoglycan-binding protein [Catenulispora sp. NF23]|uniref:Peptidoglycan-binding protein n=1 Tax=Catenulispora pinistramenti TaxID=2705254 RepID=A0ABS5L679_9ACTN|nr:peptidoglycan-binding domain-containing protein [Catenulispora pinistramenti]MBS2539576.1 peptidoglycan-binding protein [Catenulispora pinistramenti]MBS2553848.1 peptidoglycan-binding protein [Catenulispora pinistramenti]
MRRIRNAAIAAVVTAAAGLIAVPAAQARVGAGWVGNGETNNPHAVWCVQNMLDGLGYNAGATDSLWGPNTRAAVLRFQTAYRSVLGTPDAIVGPSTGDELLDVWAATGHSNGWGGYCGYWLPTTHN